MNLSPVGQDRLSPAHDADVASVQRESGGASVQPVGLGPYRDGKTYPESSVSARLRDLRKEKFGAHTVDREYVERGLFRYRLLLNRSDLFA